MDGLDLRAVGFSSVFSNTTVQKNQFSGAQLSLVKLSHPYMTTGKTIVLTRWTFVSKAMSLVCNMLSRRNARIYLVLEALLWLLCSEYTIRGNNKKRDSI